MSIKFYESEVPVMSDTKKDEDRSIIVPYASGAEPYRGSVEKLILIVKGSKGWDIRRGEQT